ncbi:MAG: outer membrane beta-barrel protein [Methylocella sp.]
MPVFAASVEVNVTFRPRRHGVHDAPRTFGIIGGGPGELKCSGANTRIGGTIGAGVEYGFTPNWSAKLEYLYTAAASLELSHINEVRVGVNYRFGGL